MIQLDDLILAGKVGLSTSFCRAVANFYIAIVQIERMATNAQSISPDSVNEGI